MLPVEKSIDSGDLMAKPRATIADVARLAGVSTATAGRVLGGYGYVGAERRTEVLKAAQALAYRPNALARSLITGRTRTIGVVAGDIQNPFYASILRGIANVAEAEGLGLLITNSDEDLSREVRAVDLLMKKQVDGLILSPCDTRAAPHLDELHASGLPLVLIDRAVAGIGADQVRTDNVAAACTAVLHLIGQGHRRIGVVAELLAVGSGDIAAFVARPPAEEAESTRTLYPSWQRLLGYLKAHREAGLPLDPALIRRAGRYASDAARRQAHALLSGADRPSALFTTDATMSEGAMAAIADLRLAVPGDLSLICFDDLDWMAFTTPGISAMAQPRLFMGEAAARMLIERISGGKHPARDLVMRSALVRRASVGPPAC